MRNKQDFSRWTYEHRVGRSSREKEKTYAFLPAWEEGWSGMHLWIKGHLSCDLEDECMLVELKGECRGERNFSGTETSTYKGLQVRMSIKFEELRSIQNNHSTKCEEWGGNDTREVVKNHIKEEF